MNRFGSVILTAALAIALIAMPIAGIADSTLITVPLLEDALRVMSYLNAGYYESLSNMIHPERGLTFSPYAYVEADALVFTADGITTAAASDDPLQWGHFDGSGEPIMMTFAQYMEKFVKLDRYLVDPIIGVNRVVQSGNTIINIKEAFGEDAQFVEFNYPGTEEVRMDWRSIRLVFVDGGLVGVVGDQWTI